MYRAYISGVCRPNPGRAAFSYIIINPENREIFQDNGLVANYGTSNIAEYTALIKALEQAAMMGIKMLAVYSSNRLVIDQVNGTLNANDPDLAVLCKKTIRLASGFNRIAFLYIPSEQNRRARSFASSILNDKPETRRAKAERLAQSAFVKTNDGFLFLKKDKHYTVNPLNNTCSCPDQQKRGGLCKHLMAARLIENRLTNAVLESQIPARF